MKKHGVLNSEISKVLADLGHTDTICISDCGLPFPDGIKKIDLAITYGDPSFLKVLRNVLFNMVVEEITLASEIKQNNKNVFDETLKLTKKIKHTYVSHEEFKLLTKNCKAIIRTGENTPYANIILKSGVYFGEEV